jgi:hypothetical protein
MAAGGCRPISKGRTAQASQKGKAGLSLNANLLSYSKHDRSNAWVDALERSFEIVLVTQSERELEGIACPV